MLIVLLFDQRWYERSRCRVHLMRDYLLEIASLHVSDSISVTHWQLATVPEEQTTWRNE